MPYWQVGVFFCDFAPFLFSIENKSAFRADPNVPITGSYTAVVRKLSENKNFGNFHFWPKYGCHKKAFLYFFKKWPNLEKTKSFIE